MQSQLEKDLMAARALIDSPLKWCPKGALGRRVFPTGEEFPTRCAMQAVLEATDYAQERYEACARALYEAMPTETRKRLDADLSEVAKQVTDWDRHVLVTRDTVVAWYNDLFDTLHADIMALFDRPIEAERAKRAQLAIVLRMHEHIVPILRDLRIDTQVQQIMRLALEAVPPWEVSLPHRPLAQCPKVDEPA